MRGAPILGILSALGLLLPPVSNALFGMPGTLSWLVDLSSHWQWLFLSGLVLSAGIAASVRRRWALLLLAVPLPWLTASADAPSAVAADPLLVVGSANVSLANRNVAPLAAWLAEAQVDVAVLFEVSDEFARGLATLPGYRFRRVAPGSGPFGIAVLSRHRLSDLSLIRDAMGVAHIEARLHWRGRELSLVALHPMPPLSPAYQAARDARLVRLAEAITRAGRPGVLAGDLNATPWSGAFARLAQLGLRRATGLGPSWPAAMRGLMGIPIDHVLVTSHWRVADSGTGPELGSDHLPVLARLSLPAAGATARPD